MALFVLALFAPIARADETTLAGRLAALQEREENWRRPFHRPTAEESKPLSIRAIGLTGEWRWFPSDLPYAIRVTEITPGSVLDRARDVAHPHRRIQPGDYLRFVRRAKVGEHMTKYISTNFTGIYLVLADLTTYDFNAVDGHVYFEVNRFRDSILAEEAKSESDVQFFSSEFRFDLNIPPDDLKTLKDVAATIPETSVYSNYISYHPNDFNVRKFGPPSFDFRNRVEQPFDISAALVGLAAATAIITLSTEQGEQTGICNKRTGPVWIAIAREDHNMIFNPNFSAPTLNVETNIKLAPGECHDRRVTDEHNMWFAVYELGSTGVRPLLFSSSGKETIDYAKDRMVSHLCVNPESSASYRYAGGNCASGSVPVPVSFGLRGQQNSSQTVHLE